MRGCFYSFLFLAITFAGLNPAFAESESPENIITHNLGVSISPSTHGIAATDTITGIKPGKVEFILAPGLQVTEVIIDGQEVEFEHVESTLSFEVARNTSEFAISYKGEIYDPVEKSTTLTFVRGDRTKGLIGLEGVFLTPGSGWYPSLKSGKLSLFKLDVTIGDGLTSVSQGELVDRRTSGDTDHAVWRSDVPTDGLVLVAGKYHVYSMEQDGVTYSTYLTKKNKDLSRLLLETSADYVSFYSSILGPYPHPGWAIVENFFSSGYGMPGFTLLDPRIVAQGRRLLQPGYLDHEIVHSWFGNYIFPLYEEGNWAEGLTTYLTNYLYHERGENPAEALRHRIRTVERFNIMVDPDLDYPVKDFTSKAEEYDSNIGYGKTSMLFHMLRSDIGDDSFFRGLKEFVKKFGGMTASWQDMKKTFEDAADIKLRGFFRQWLERTGGPVITLSDVALEKTGNGDYLVTGSIEQEAPYYDLQLPLAVMSSGGRVGHIVTVSGKNTRFSLTLTSRPEWIAIDPEYQIFRIIKPQDLHPSLSRLLESGTQSYMAAADSPDGQVEILFQRLKDQKGGWIIDRDSLFDALGMGGVFIAGSPHQAGVPGLKHSLLSFLPGSFTFEGQSYADPDHAILFSMDNPYSPGSVVTILAGNSPEALQRAGYIPYYKNDTFVIFKAGRPIKRGYLPFLGPGVSHIFR